jgi:hypothetical protein
MILHLMCYVPCSVFGRLCYILNKQNAFNVFFLCLGTCLILCFYIAVLFLRFGFSKQKEVLCLLLIAFRLGFESADLFDFDCCLNPRSSCF